MTDVLITTAGAIGRLSLNRPKALHALNQAMCETMLGALAAWRGDPAIRLITIDHAAGRGFCAGGDIRAARESGLGDGAAARRLFHTEYRLNHMLFTCPTPVAAFMDGVTMGGGAGLALPARYRIATENTLFAMPEAAIGLFPDIGAGWYLSRLPGRTGAFLALTGARLDGAECLALGLATHYLPAAVLAETKDRLAARPDEAEAILAAVSVPPPPARIARHRDAIDRLFAPDRYEAILAALAADPSPWAATERATLAAKSPTTCKVALRLLAEGRARTDFAEEMVVEYRLAARISRSHDFIEGVRALIVDKDNAPRWDPATPEGVSDAMLDALFAPLPPGEEWTPWSDFEADGVICRPGNHGKQTKMRVDPIRSEADRLWPGA
ncbi:MAG TPA: enoyl-CoA hydratase/isomerase family protein [Sphingomonadaceae bacterium]|nr:enoyl-CoA hydratase/isomerase family protein [Sphingomonadaceae bacterium]